MNIFKILTSGDGTLKEPNLSAFLGYLLNPKADHGLNDAFLKKVLEPFLKISGDKNPIRKLFSNIEESEDEELYILDLGVNTRFNVEVVLEKALKSKSTENRQIVDIIIKITERPQVKKEDVSYLFAKAIPIALILIENKI